MDYEKKDTWWSGKNKPNSKPIQTQTNPIYEKQKTNVNKVLTKGYENKSHFWVKAKQTQFKPKQTQFVVSLPALSAVEGAEPISEAKNAASCVFKRGGPKAFDNNWCGAMSCERVLQLRWEDFSKTLKISKTVTRPCTLPCWSTTGKHNLPALHICSIIAVSGVSGVTVQVGLLIIHLTLI